MKRVIILLIMLTSVFVIGCTENEMAKNYGGQMKIDLPVNQKLVTATWKESQLWYLTEEMEEGYKPNQKMFKEESNYGIMEGSVIFNEKKVVK